MSSTFSQNQKMLHVEPQGDICYNCDFCRKEFRGENYYCALKKGLSHLVDLDERLTYEFEVGCIFTTSCQYFTRTSAMEALMNEESLEKFEIMKSLGKFDGVPDLILVMRRNWFVDKHDATQKQLEYSRYLAEKNGLVLPAKIDGSGYCCQITRCEDQGILRSWIGSVIPSLKTQLM